MSDQNVYTPAEQEKNGALVQIACDDYPGPGLLSDDIQHMYGVVVGAFDADYWFLTPEAVAALGEFTPVVRPIVTGDVVRDQYDERNHTVTEFKKGDRVIVNDIFSDSLFCGTVDDMRDSCVHGTRDAGGRFVRWPWHLTKITDPAPLRFEDVRDGDTITVEGEDYSITGTSWTEPGDPPRVTVGGVTIFNLDGDEGTHGPYGPPVRLTAHTPAPAEPEWHRAKVIMGCYTEDGTPDEPEYWLLGWDGLFYSVSGAAEDYELTNVTIIVDKHGRVRA
jgi:hypothetical protein